MSIVVDIRDKEVCNRVKVDPECVSTTMGQNPLVLFFQFQRFADKDPQPTSHDFNAIFVCVCLN